MPSPNQISVSQLARLIGTPDCPVIIDLRIDEDFEADPRLLPTAFRYSFTEIESLTPNLQGKRVVLYCQKGKKISEGAVALLRCHGIAAECLEGGQFGWREGGQLMIPADKVSNGRMGSATVWVTRHRPKIDRTASTWLIRRFVDPAAKFLFVAPREVMDVADKFSATPFDVEDVFWTHRGEHCTFDTMIDECELRSDALDRLATIVRGADTNRHDLAPEAAGLLAASLGLSRMYRDDLQQLDAGMLLYDAMYRWARDAVDEGHDWPTASGQRN